MQKKLLAVAIAGAFGAPALTLAQTSTVQVFGTIYMEYTVHADQGRNPAGADRSFPEDYAGHDPIVDDYPAAVSSCPYTRCIGGGERI